MDKVKVKIDGVEKEMDLAEVIQLAEKAGGADEKFRQAAEIRKAQDRLRVLSNKADMTREEFYELGNLMGHAEDKIAKSWELLNSYKEIEDEDQGDGKGTIDEGDEMNDVELKLLERDRKIEELNSQLLNIKSDSIARARREIQQELKNKLDTSPRFGTLTPERRALIVSEFLTPALQKLVANGESYGPATVEKAMVEAEKKAIALGVIQSEAEVKDSKAKDLEDMLGSTGLGSVPKVVQAIKSGEAIERPKPGNHVDYEHFIAARLSQEANVQNLTDSQ